MSEMSDHIRTLSRRWLLLAGLAMTTACGAADSLLQPPPESPLAGLNQGIARTSEGVIPPASQASDMPGSIFGTVVGRSVNPQPGEDTIATAPRIVGATVRVYHRLSVEGETTEVGDLIATTQTGADGKFSFANLAGGPVVVTVQPPTGTSYQGQWLTGTISESTADYPWWLVLHDQ